MVICLNLGVRLYKKKKNIYIYLSLSLFKKKIFWGFPGSSVVKNLPANVGDVGLIPSLGRPHMLRSN